MHVSARLCFVVALAALTATAAPARADDTSAAREHYQKGTSYYDLGRYMDAIREFEAAYEIKNDPALLYNLAQSHRLAGNSDQALHFYRTYLRRVPKAPNRAEIESRITQLEQLVAQKNAAQTAPPNVTIPPGGAIPPGSEATAPPPPPPVTTAPPTTTAPPPEAAPPWPTGQSTPAPPPVTMLPPPVTPPPSEKAAKLKKWGMITMIAGGALVIIGAAEGARTSGANNDIEAAAKNGGTFDPSIESRGKNAQGLEAFFLSVGVLAAGAGAGLFFYGRHEEQAATLTVTPVASAGAMGAFMRVTY